MSRHVLRPSLGAFCGTTYVPRCLVTGTVRGTESLALSVLRNQWEEERIKDNTGQIGSRSLRGSNVATYLLNEKPSFSA